MKPVVPNILKRLIGLPCREARTTLSDILVLGFGNMIQHDHFKFKNINHFEWEISSETSSWRLIKNNHIRCGYGDVELGGYGDEDVGPCLKELVGLSIIEISHTSLYDVRLCFDNNYEVQILAQSHSGDYLSILAPDLKYITFKSENRWLQQSSLSPLYLSEQEVLYSNHSELCSKRWMKVVNKVSGNICSDCAFYLQLSGRYYFGDFGLCSNKMSPQDGKLVGMSSGCCYFDTTLINI